MTDKIIKDLETLGITGVKTIHHNPSYEEIFKMEMDPSLTGYDKGQLTELDDRHLYRPFAQRQIHCHGCEIEGHGVVDHP